MNNLETLKKGDKVIAIHNHRFGDTYVSGAFIVDHVTPTMVIGTKHPSLDIPPRRVRIDTAEEVGTKYSGTRYYAIDHPEVAKVKQAELDAIAFGAFKGQITTAVEQATSKNGLAIALTNILNESYPPEHQPATEPVTQPVAQPSEPTKTT